MILGQVFSPSAININLESSEKDEVFEELIEELVSIYPEISRSAALTALIDREQKLSTGIGRGVAVLGFSSGGGFGYTGDSGDSGGVLVGAGEDGQEEIVEVCGVVVDGGEVLVDMVCGEEEDVLF